jgi:hypothetical protein
MLSNAKQFTALTPDIKQKVTKVYSKTKITRIVFNTGEMLRQNRLLCDKITFTVIFCDAPLATTPLSTMHIHEHSYATPYEIHKFNPFSFKTLNNQVEIKMRNVAGNKYYHALGHILKKRHNTSTNSTSLKNNYRIN